MEHISTHEAYYAPSPPSSHNPSTCVFILLSSSRFTPCLVFGLHDSHTFKISLPLFGSPCFCTVHIQSATVSMDSFLILYLLYMCSYSPISARLYPAHSLSILTPQFAPDHTFCFMMSLSGVC